MQMKCEEWNVKNYQLKILECENYQLALKQIVPSLQKEQKVPNELVNKIVYETVKKNFDWIRDSFG